MGNIRGIFSKLGPGLLMAGAAIGVSHFVQSTRAGAGFGWSPLLFILAANFFKYPFFEYGHRYASATNESLLSGYLKLGKGYLWTFFCVNFLASFVSIAAVSFVTASLLQNIFLHVFAIELWSALLMLFCLLLVAVGQYKTLDLLMKIMMAFLVVGTVSAFTSAAWNAPASHFSTFGSLEMLEPLHLAFLIALMGWMPAPIEISVWQSLWMVEKNKSETDALSVSEAKFDFNLGYGLTVVLAVLFCGLGALTLYGSGATFSSVPADFSSQVISLYTKNIGEWARPIIAVTAFVTMFSTSLTLIDAYPRSLIEALRVGFEGKFRSPLWSVLTYLFLCTLGFVTIVSFSASIKTLIDWVTISAFLSGPLFAFLNFKLLCSEHTPLEHRPGPALRSLSVAGLVFLLVFAGIFVYSRMVA